MHGHSLATIIINPLYPHVSPDLPQPALCNVPVHLHLAKGGREGERGKVREGGMEGEREKTVMDTGWGRSGVFLFLASLNNLFKRFIFEKLIILDERRLT